MRTFVSVLTFVGLLAAGLSQAGEGKPFVDFEGQYKTVEDYFDNEKWTVVMIWRHDCHICNQEIDSYAFFHDGNPAANVLGLSIDGMAKKADAENFIAAYDLPFENLLGEIGDVAKYYQDLTGRRFLGTPSFLIFNPQGQLAANRVGAVAPEMISNFIRRSTSSSKE